MPSEPIVSPVRSYLKWFDAAPPDVQAMVATYAEMLGRVMFPPAGDYVKPADVRRVLEEGEGKGDSPPVVVGALLLLIGLTDQTFARWSTNEDFERHAVFLSQIEERAQEQGRQKILESLETLRAELPEKQKRWVAEALRWDEAKAELTPRKIDEYLRSIPPPGL